MIASKIRKTTFGGKNPAPMRVKIFPTKLVCTRSKEELCLVRSSNTIVSVVTSASSKNKLTSSARHTNVQNAFSSLPLKTSKDIAAATTCDFSKSLGERALKAIKTRSIFPKYCNDVESI